MGRRRSSKLRSFPRGRESRGGLFGTLRFWPWVPAFAGTSGLSLALVLITIAAAAAQAQHACDAIGEEGWHVVAPQETTEVRDGAPHQIGDDWFVDRTTTLLPLCNYFNAAGNYSLRSYSLDPIKTTQRVTLCRAGKTVAPYAGRCPPE
jgi:hypothetical protein